MKAKDALVTNVQADKREHATLLKSYLEISVFFAHRQGHYS